MIIYRILDKIRCLTDRRNKMTTAWKSFKDLYNSNIEFRERAEYFTSQDNFKDLLSLVVFYEWNKECEVDEFIKGIPNIDIQIDIFNEFKKLINLEDVNIKYVGSGILSLSVAESKIFYYAYYWEKIIVLSCCDSNYDREEVAFNLACKRRDKYFNYDNRLI